MQTCKKCGFVNDDGVLFCQECSEQLQVRSGADIERMRHSAHCPTCDYYNPIENDRCAKCGFDLRAERGILVRDRRGRVSLIRDAEHGRLALGASWVGLAAVVLLLAGITISTASSLGSVTGLLMDVRGQSTLLCWLALTLALGGEWKAGPIYRLKTALVIVVAFLACAYHFGVAIVMGEWNLDVLLLVAVAAMALYGELYILRGRVTGTLLTPLMAFVGLYGSTGFVVALVHGGGLGAAVSFAPRMELPLEWYLTPSFVVFHLFMPYCFLQMLGGAATAYLRSMEHVDGTKSIVRFLNRRKEEARGELLNVFALGLALYIGFRALHMHGVPNGYDLVLLGWTRIVS